MAQQRTKNNGQFIMQKPLENLIKEASSLLQKQDFVRAIKLYKQALKQQPNNAAAQMCLAMAYNHEGEHKKALELLLALWQTIQSQNTEAQAKIDAATLAEILAQIGLALQHLGDLQQALIFYTQANTVYSSELLTRKIAELSETAPNSIEQLLYQANSYQASQQWDDAIASYQSALQLNPDHDRAQHGLGNALRVTGNLSAALPYIQQAIIMQPEVAEYHNTLGMLFQQRGEYEKAITFHKRAINLDANYAAAYSNLGVALKNQNRTEEAISAYQQALKINPNMPEVHNNLGNLLRIMGDLRKAKASLKKALKLRPDYADAKKNLDEMMGLGKTNAKKSVK